MSTLTFDTEANVLYIYVRAEPSVLQQRFDQGCLVDIGASGNVCGIQITNPGIAPWPADEILSAYAPSFGIDFAAWFLRLAAQYPVWGPTQLGNEPYIEI